MDKNKMMFEGQKWGSVPISVYSVNVSLPARCLYSLLWTFVNPHSDYSVFPSQELLASILGVTERQIRRYLTELENAGCLIKKYRTQVDPTFSGNPAARLYVLVLPQAVRGTGQICPVRPDTGDRSDRTPVTAEQTKEQTTEQDSDVVQTLKEQEISDSQAKSLAKNYDEKRIYKAVEVFIQGNRQNQNLGPGWLVKFIKEDWHVPNWFVEDSDSVESRQKYLIGLA